MEARPLRGWRRIAGAMWRDPDDPQIFGVLEHDATALLAFIAAAREAGHRLTPTHLVGRAVALALRAVPDLNTRIAFGRLHPRPSVDIFFITSVAGGRDLSGVKVERADEKSAHEIGAELAARADRLRAGRDARFARSKALMDALPGPLLRLALRASSWLASKHGLAVPPLGLEALPFGSAMVTSVGMFGLPMGFAPLAWMYQVPLLVLVGEIADRPVARDGQVVIRPVLPMTFTIDHRYVDGWHISQALKPLRAYLDDPAAHEPG